MSKHKYKILAFFTLLGLASWVLDAFLESFEKDIFFQHRHFADLLIVNIPIEEIITRSIMVLTLIIFGICIDRYLAKVEKSEEQLQQSEQRLSRLAAQLLTIQESERSRISKELHDELGQDMMLLQFQLRAINEKFNNKSLRHDLDPIVDNVEATIENLRRLTKDLSPVSLENLGLTAAIESLIEESSKSSGVEATVNLEDIDHLLSPQARLNIYRVFQEALTNIFKHAQARHLSAVLRRQDGLICLEISDDGQGFDVQGALANSYKARNFGLNTMTERVRLLGGVLKLESQPGAGTKIIITLPVEEGAADGPLPHIAGR